MELENLRNLNPSICISGKVRRLNRLTANVFRKYLKPFNVTDSQLSLLFMFSKRDFTQKELAEKTGLEKSSLNRNLQRLFESNYISRSDFPVIKITSSGSAFVNDIIPEWKKAMSEIRQLLGVEGEEALNLVMNKLKQ